MFIIMLPGFSLATAIISALALGVLFGFLQWFAWRPGGYRAKKSTQKNAP